MHIHEVANGYTIEYTHADWTSDMYVFKQWNEVLAFLKDFKFEKEEDEAKAS